MFDTPTLRLKSPLLGAELRLSGSETGFLAFSGPPRRSSAPPRQTFPPRRSEASPKRTYKFCFSCFLPLSLTIIHWINENPNK